MGSDPMNRAFFEHAQGQLDQLRADAYFKAERVMSGPQSAQVRLQGGALVLNFCANNYLGLANDSRLIQAAKQGLDEAGFGLASVRFICGTQAGHKALEESLAAFLKMEDAVLYSSCFDANG